MGNLLLTLKEAAELADEGRHYNGAIDDDDARAIGQMLDAYLPQLVELVDAVKCIGETEENRYLYLLASNLRST